MCGIAGFVGDFSEQELRAMTRLLVHRGPDDEGYYRDGQVGLGHRRLSIIDIATGQQPMSNEDGTVWIAYNGEVYNFRQLRAQYLSAHEFKTASDTEVILHLYEEFGEDCLDHLRGMFAFAIWDKPRRKLFLARDRFGIKPLYYAETPRGLAFASECKALLGAGIVSPEVRLEAMPAYLTFRYVPGAMTMFRGIDKLEPACSLVVERGKTRRRKYWSLDFTKDEGRSVQSYADRLTELLEESISLRLISEVPLGAYLSGGLDSSFIVGLMSRLQTEPVDTFTVSLDGRWHDESRFARIVADEFSTRHRELKVTSEALTILNQVTWHLDEPLGDAATIPTFLMSELTRRHVTVVLSGEGADELLAGYDKYKAVLYGGRLKHLLGTWPFACGRSLASGITTQRVLQFLATRDPAAAYLSLASVFTDEEQARLCGPLLQPVIANGHAHDIVSGVLGKECDELDPLDRLMALDLETWLPNDVLLKNDKMTMAHSLEARVPFLDHVLAEYLASIPSRLKLKWFKEKYVLRRAMQPLIPREVVRRKKHGFTVPISHWMEHSLRPLVRRLLARERVEADGLWNHSFLEQLMAGDLSNQYRRRQLWTIVTFELWRDVFINNAGRVAER